MCAEKRPNARDVMDNLKKPMPLGKKFAVLIRNSFIKITKLRSCCGHPGEPGC
jgi:hypothetical protein